MDPELKVARLKDVEYKAEGTLSAVFATLNVRDLDGDMILPGAIGEQRVRLSAYNHGSWQWGMPAIGKGRVFERGKEAVFEGQFFMAMATARETFESVKGMGDLQEYSWGLMDIESETQTTAEGERTRLVKSVKIPEVSPVLLGASINTHTLDIKHHGKGMRLADHVESLLAEAGDVAERLREVSEKRAEDGRTVSPVTMEKAAALAARLREIVGLLDNLQRHPEADETQKQAAREYLRTLELQTMRSL